MRKQIKDMIAEEKLLEYKRLEQNIRLGYLPFSVEESDKRRQQEIYDSTDDVNYRKQMAKVKKHLCQFHHNDNYCTICGLDGRA